jgi:hypothetical protein
MSAALYCGPRRGRPSPLQYDSLGGTTSASSAMCLLLMYCGPRRGEPSQLQYVRREGRPPRRPQCVCCSLNCGPLGGEPYPLQYDSLGGTTSVSSAMCLLLMYCSPLGGGPSPLQYVRQEGRPPRRPQCRAVRAEADPPLYTAAVSTITVVDCLQKSRTLTDATFL